MQANAFKLALIGNPIQHSLSPQIWQYFAVKYNINLKYDKILVNNTNECYSILDNLFAQGFYAINITSPYKNIVYDYSKERSRVVEYCKSGNLLYNKYLFDAVYRDNIANTNSINLNLHKVNHIVANSTDGPGLVNDFYNKKINLNNKRILILGSGYVVENILFTLSAYNLSQIDIYARNNTRIQYIDKHFKLMFLNLNTQFNCILQNPQNININNYDIIINTIPANAINAELFSFNNNDNNNISGNISGNIFSIFKQLDNSSKLIIYDMNYSNPFNNTKNYDTLLLKYIKFLLFHANSNNIYYDNKDTNTMDILKKQVLVYDGFGMLFEQAQIAFNKLFNIQQINIDISINDFFLFMQKASL